MTVIDYKSISTTEDTVVTIGNFDGVHKGHRFLIEKTRLAAEKLGLKSVILTFSPHPRDFFEHKNFPLITVNDERELIFDSLGIDYKFFTKFDEALSSLTASEFVADILADRLRCKLVVIGENYRFGSKREGDVLFLKRLCAQKGIDVQIYESVQAEGETVSSARIRALIAEGKVKEAASLLGKPYFIYGKIVSGRSLGRTLGFPTINQAVAKNKLLPRFGVYFTKTAIGETFYNGITNVGVKPTVGGAHRTVETFLFGFDGDIYGKNATVMFLERTRDEVRFEGIEELKSAINSDIGKAKLFFRQAERHYE